MNNLQVRQRKQPPNVQHRRAAPQAIALRFTPPAQDGQPYKFEGYAVTWANVNSHGERFEKGAFADLIASGKQVHMYYNHAYMDWLTGNSAKRIGKWVELVEDDTGLLVKGELTPNMSQSNDVAAMLAHGTVDGLSIAFYEPNPIDVYTDNTGARVIKRVDLYEISVVDEPSDQTARIAPTTEAIDAVRSADDANNLLVSMGLSKDDANLLLARLDDVLHVPNRVNQYQSVLDALEF